MNESMNRILKFLLLVVFASFFSSCNDAGQRSRSEEETAVYSLLLDNYAIGDTVYISEETHVEWFEYFLDDSNVLEQLPALKKETLANYREVNQSPAVITANLTLNKPYEILDTVELDNRENDYWEKENQNWYYTHPVMTLSRIGFDKEFKQALVYLEYYCGSECGGGNLYFLTRSKGDVWEVESIFEGWIS